MEIVFVFGMIIAYVFISSFYKLLIATIDNCKTLVGIKQPGGYLRQLEYVNEYAKVLLFVVVPSVLIIILFFLSTLDVGISYSNLIKTILFILFTLISMMALGLVNWAVGEFVTSRFSLSEREGVYPDLLLDSFPGLVARIKFGNIVIMHLITALSALSIAIYLLSKIYELIFIPIFMWLFAQ